MTERALIHRELVRQTALLFFVFALLFALLGAGVYSMVSSNIYRNADENLQAIGMESDYITLDAAGSGSAIVDSSPHHQCETLLSPDLPKEQS